MKRLSALFAMILMAPLLAAADPPGRVARLALVEGQAAVFVDPELGWEEARINSHLTSENSVWTEPGARAEVRFGSNALRLGEVTQLDIARLDDDTLQAHVARGTLAVRIRNTDPGQAFQVSTPQARFQLRGNGRYRIDADMERGESRIAVFEGSARLEASGGTITIDTGRAVLVTGAPAASYRFEPAYLTALDEWALARDRRFEEREAARYLPPEMTGWEELDDYGVWRNEPEYGVVWYPTRVDAGWAPYRYGRWTWVRPWGWAWVDDAPWGYAPFHYGRWVSIGNRWAWYPGRYTTRPVWAPALVGWVGSPGWSISISTGLAGVVGWYPLSPYDAYQPWYAANVTYVTNVNRIVMPHRRDRGPRDGRRDDRRDGWRDNRDRGATVVSRQDFGSRRPVQNVIAPVSRDVVAAQPVVRGSSVLPSRDDWRTRNRAAEVAKPPGLPAAPFRGEPVNGSRQPSRLAPAPTPAGPLVKPSDAPSAPSQTARPPAPPAQYTQPTPAPDAPVAKPRVSPPQPAAKPTQQESSSWRGAPAQPSPKPMQQESSSWRGAPAQPVAKPSLAPQGARPVAPSPMIRPAPAQPSAAPVPALPAAKPPAPATERPIERPARPSEEHSGG